MHALVGPIILKEGGYAFDLWTPEEGLRRGYAYNRIEDAHYARNVELKSRRWGRSGPAIACGTLDEFALANRRTRSDFSRPGVQPRGQVGRSHSPP
jgi:hypothetical protein